MQRNLYFVSRNNNRTYILTRSIVFIDRRNTRFRCHQPLSLIKGLSEGHQNVMNSSLTNGQLKMSLKSVQKFLIYFAKNKINICYVMKVKVTNMHVEVKKNASITS